MSSLFESIKNELLSWPEVTCGEHRFGGTEFRVGGKEMGHMHGLSWADLPFPMNIRNELLKSGKASPHHVLPQSGWVTFYIKNKDDDEDVQALLKLFKMQYERLKR